MRVVLIRFHNLGPSVSHGRLAAQSRDSLPSHASSLLLLGTLFEEDFSEDVLLLGKSVVVFDIVVVRLVKHAV